jgi:hypothetical protein
LEEQNIKGDEEVLHQFAKSEFQGKHKIERLQE